MSSHGVNLSIALALVSSDKVKERAEGLLLIKRIFSISRNCEALTNTGYGRDGAESNGWLKVFQTLFGCAGVERSASLKASKSTAGTSASSAATTRLASVASHIRWLIETSLTYLNKRTIASIFAHLVQSIIHRGVLLEYIATDYAKSLKAIFSYRPHLDWLEERNWRVLMSLCFDVALGRMDLSFDRDEWDEDGENESGRRRSGEGSDNMDVDGEEIDELESVHNKNGKRPASSTSTYHKHQLSRTTESTHSNETGKYTTAAIELISLIPILLASQSAPLLAPPRFEIAEGDRIPSRAGLPILRKVLAFLERHTEEVTPTKYMVHGLNVLLAELELNCIEQVSLIGTKLFPHLMKLWPAKDVYLRDNLLLSMRILLPFLCRASSFAETFNPARPRLTLPDIRLSTEIVDSLTELVDRLIKPTLNGGRRLLEISTRSLWYVFEIDRPGEATPKGNPWKTRVMRAGATFDLAGALAWVGFELRADVIAQLYSASMAGSIARQPRKQRKTGDPVESLLAAASSKGSPNRLIEVQTLFFLVERRWTSLHQQLQADICTSMADGLADPSADIQEWAFLVLNSAVQQGGADKVEKAAPLTSDPVATDIRSTQTVPDSPYTSDTGEPLDSLFWDTIWTVAIRKVSLIAGPVARSAAHMVQAIWHSKRIERSKALKAIESFLRDIAIQGPAKASDAVCSLVSMFLVLVAHDIVLMRAGLEDNVCTWLSGSGLDIVAPRSGTSALTPFCYSSMEVLRLMARLGGLTIPSLSTEGQFVLEDHPLAQRMYAEMADEQLRQFLYYAKVLPTGVVAHAYQRQERGFNKDNRMPGDGNPQRSRQRMTLLRGALMQRNRDAFQQWEDNATTTVSVLGHGLMTPEVPLFRSAIDQAVMSIMFESFTLEQDDQDTREGLANACRLLGRILAKVFKNNFRPLAQAHILLGIDPLLGPYRCDALEGPLRLLTQPEQVEGIVSESFNITYPDMQDSFDWDAALTTVWQMTEVLEMWSPLVEAFRDVFRSDDSKIDRSKIAKQAQDDDDQDFHIRDGGGIDQATIEPMAGASTSAVDICAQVCVRALLKPKHYQVGMSRPIKERSLLNLTIQADGDVFLCLAPAVLRAVSEGLLDLKSDALEALLEAINEFLSSYQFACSTKMRCLAIRFIALTRCLWTDRKMADSDLAQHFLAIIIRFCISMEAGRIAAWAVRRDILITLTDYIRAEPNYGMWEESALTELPPISFVQTCLEDPDCRIRAQAAISMASVFEMPSVPHAVADPWELYSQTSNYFFNSMHIPADHVRTRLLFFANVAVSSDICRRASLYHMYDMTPNWPVNCPYVLACLQSVAGALGLSSIKPLYLEYAPRLTASQEEDGQEHGIIPMPLYGYKNRQDWNDSALPIVDPVLLQLGDAHRWQQFHPNDGAQAMCRAWPQSLAMTLAFAARAFDRTASMQGLDEVMNDTVKRSEQKYKEMSAMYPAGIAPFSEACDPYYISSGLFALIDDSEDTDCVVDTLKSLPNGGRIAETFLALTETGQGEAGIHLHEVNMPRAPFSHVMEAFQWTRKYFADKLNSVQLAHHLLNETLNKVNSSILVNERRRFLKTMLLTVALHEAELLTPSSSRVVLRMCALLSGPADTASQVTSLVLRMINDRKVLETDGHEVAVLVASIADLAHGHIGSSKGTNSTLFQGFVSALEYHLGGALGIPIVQQTAAKSLLLWPRTLPQELNAQMQDLDAKVPLALLRHRTGSASKLALSKNLLRRSQMNGIDHSDEIFWYLRESPIELGSNWDDVKAFLELFRYGAAFVSIPNDRTLDHLLNDPRPGELEEKASHTEFSLRKIIWTVYEIYATGTFAAFRSAYGVLSSLAHVPSAHRVAKKMGAQVQHDLSMIRPTLIPSVPLSAIYLTVLETDPSWLTKAADPHEWIRALALLLSAKAGEVDATCASLAQLLSYNISAAKSILPPVTHLLLAAELGSGQRSASIQGAARSISGYFDNILGSHTAALEAKRVIIDVVLYLRCIPFPSPGSNHLEANAWLHVDYTSLTHAAIACKAYPTALLFYELSIDPDACVAGHASPLESRELDEVLHAIYTHVPEPDAFYGIPQTYETDLSLLQRLDHEKDSAKAFMHYAAAHEVGASYDRGGLTTALQAFGYDHLAADLVFSGAHKQADTLQPGCLAYNLAWRTGNWDLPTTAGRLDMQDVDASLYHVLQLAHRGRDNGQLERRTKQAIVAEMSKLRRTEQGNLLGLKASMLRLLRLREVLRWAEIYEPLVSSLNFEEPGWTTFTEIGQGSSSHDDRELMEVRLSLIKSAIAIDGPSIGTIQSPRAEALHQLQLRCHLSLSRLARNDGHVRAAINSMANIDTISRSLRGTESAESLQESAQVLWAQGEHAYAINILQNATRQRATASGSGTLAIGWQATAKSTLGEWMAEARQASPDTIEREYFEESLALCTSAKADMSVQDQADIYFRYAKYSDEQQRNLHQSNEERTRRIQADHPRLNAEIARLATANGTETGQQRDSRLQHRSDLVADRNRDIEDMADNNRRRRGSVVSALVNYARTIALTNSHDTVVMQLCALWMEQHANEGANIKLRPVLDRVPSHKFIFLAHQLTSRLTTESLEGHKGQSTFQKNLERLVTTIAVDHPFHITYQILTMAYPTQPFAATASSRRVSSGKQEEVTFREEAAIAIHLKLRAHGARGAVVKDMEAFVLAAVNWSWIDSPNDKAIKLHGVPSDAPIARLCNMSIPVVSADVPVDLSKEYRNIARIKAYDRKYSIAGGIHRPKIMLCQATDGKKYRELFKADDDLRQDSVMEQFFALVNRILKQDAKTLDRELRFRTYNVIPLARQTGIIEFVGDTMSLGDYLNPAHKRYRPNDISAKEIKDQMKKMQESELGKSGAQCSGLPKLLATLQENFRPVMRHLFTEKKHDPMAWYAMRLRYARSLAVGSIAGHVVGLGDRHCSNILIDKSMGELVHIDLGIAFDQGRRLTIPELVPFRLTNDLVDGLGSSGVEGVYKRCCEETLRVLRDNSQLVLTVLEVFKHDPLYTWTKNNKMGRTQGGVSRKDTAATIQNSAEYSKADRILGEVAKKLDKHMSIEYAVNDLIRSARDLNNLAVIFTGWQCWL